jgi:excinuclease ABC subunit A
LLAPVVRGRKGEYRKELAEWQKAGFTRVRIDGQFHDIEDAPALDKKYKHDIEVVVDRIVIREGIETRLADSFETALKLAEGLAYLDPADVPHPAGSERTGVAKALEAAADREGFKLDYAPPGRITFSEKFACPVSGFTIAEIEPRLFSFNAPQGACPACDGLGEKQLFDEDLVVPNHALSLKKGAVVPWAKSQPPSPYYMQVLGSLAREYGFSLETPWGELGEEAHRVILRGTGGRPVTLRFVDGKKSYEVKKPFEGVIGNLERRMLSTESAWMREELSNYQAAHPCETCGGARLRPEPLAVKIAGEDISLSSRRSVADALAWFSALDQHLTPTQNEIASAILKEINERLGFLHNVGLDYLNLDRTSGTLSGGESQRIRLASQIGSGLSGVLYVLDEPSIGLTRRTMTASSKRCSASRASATPSWWSSMTRTRSATPTMSSTWAPAPASMAAKWSAPARSSISSPARTASPPTISPAAATSRCAPSAARARARSSPSTARARTTSRTLPRRSRSAPSPASPASRAAASRR